MTPLSVEPCTLALFGALGIHVFFARFFDLGAWRARALGILRFFSWRRDR